MIYTKDASGTTEQWQLTQMRVSEHTDLPQQYWSKDGVRQLVVVTCGGVVRGGHYDKNVFAIASPVEVNVVVYSDGAAQAESAPEK